ncbi:MAG: flagellar motor switch protein FliN [Candidatus Velthaea sp.]
MEKRIAEAMFASAAGVLSTLVDRTVAAGPSAASTSESSIRVESDVVATITQIPAAGFSFVTRFEKSDLSHIVELMLGSPSSGEMDALQLSIVAETVAQIASAMAEQLTQEIKVSPEGIHSEVVNETGAFPAPPFMTYAVALDVGSEFNARLTIDFDGVAKSKMNTKETKDAKEAKETRSVKGAKAAAAAAAAADAAAVATRAAAPAPQSQPVAFTAMAPTPIRAAAPGQANLDLVHDIPLQISAVLGKTALSLRDVVALQSGSVFELDKLSTDPVDLYVNNILIARGEVVVVDDKFAVKISELNPEVDKV